MPGNYTLSIQLTTFDAAKKGDRQLNKSDFLGLYETEITVPEAKAQSNSDVVDLGSVTVKTNKLTGNNFFR